MTKFKEPVEMFCPNCFTIMTSYIDDPEHNILPYQNRNDHGFNGANQAAYESCDCNEDYVYVDETNVIEVLMMIVKKR